MYFCSDLFGEQVPCYLVIWPPNYFFATTMYENLRVPVRVAGEICDFLAIKRVDLGDVPHYGSSKGARSQHFQSGELGCSAPSWVTTFPGIKCSRPVEHLEPECRTTGHAIGHR